MSLAALGYGVLRYAGLTSLARRLQYRGVVLCYHNVVSQLESPAAALGLHMPVARFERQVRWLAKHFSIIRLDEFVDGASHGRSLRGVAAITFDDGYAGVFEHAWPLLSDLGIPATVFLVAEAHGDARKQGFWWDDADVLREYTPANEQRWLTTLKGDRAAIVAPGAGRLAPAWCRPATWGTIVAAAIAGLDIGAHSATHRALPTLADDELDRELVASRDLIRQHTGIVPATFAYPYGVWDDRIRNAVRSAGYRAAFTLAADRRTQPNDPWALPRLSIPAGISDSAFQAWTAGLTPRRRA